MAVQIQFRRGTAQEWSSVNPTLAEAEMGIETDTNLFKIGTGNDPWNDLPYGGLRGYAGSAGVTGSVGNIAVENVLYVSKSGNDANDGRSLSSTKLTIKSALEIAKPGTTVFVKSGDYTEDNPLRMPEQVAVVGDSLRTVSVRPLNKTQDIFWVKNGCYLSQLAFRDQEAPAAAVAFPRDGSAGAIHTSPYVQNCTSFTTTGTGMRVDGDHVGGLKSMVVDAFTQYNQGGIGIHMLNRGNTQLVSVFTICCDIGFLCESGGFCSVTNSNSSFGNYALKSDGVSTPLYSGKVNGTSSRVTFTIDNLYQQPNVGDAVKFGNSTDYYTISDATLLTSVSSIEYPNYNSESASLRNARSLILDAKTKIQIDMIDYINETYVEFSYDQFKTTRDAGFVIDAVVDDMVFNTNYRTTLAGKAYYRRSATYNREKQKTETVDALTFVKRKVLVALSESYTTSSTEYLRVAKGFDTVIGIILNGTGASFQTTSLQVLGSDGSSEAADSATGLIDTIIDIVKDEYASPLVNLPSYTWTEEGIQEKFTVLQNAKTTLKTAVTNYIASSFPILIYNVETCERDVGLVVDAISYDMLFGSNFRTIKAALSYYRAQASLVLAEQKTATIQSFNFLKTQLLILAEGDVTSVTRVSDNMDLLVDIIDNGESSVPSFVIPDPTGYNSGYANARNNLVANKDYLKAEVTKFIELNYPPFVYDQAKCERDTGLIIDGVVYDVALGTNYNSIVNGRSYLRQTASEVIGTQKPQTIGAIRFAKSLIEASLSSDVLSEKRADLVLDEILDILENGVNSVDQITWSDPGINDNKRYAREQLQAAKASISGELIEWINAAYPDLVYNNVTCARDISYIIDALSYDIQYSGNTATIVAASAYFENAVSILPLDQRPITAAAFGYLKTIIENTIISPASIAEITQANTLIDIIIDVINDDGLVNLPTAIQPTLAWVDNNIQNAIELLIEDKDTIVEQTIDYINSTYSFVYDSVKCQRDIGFIVDALQYDLTYGGNVATLNAAQSYYSGNQLQLPNKDRLPTVSAYRYLRSLVQNISLNKEVGSIDTLVWITPTNVDNNISIAFETLQLNKNYIIAEVTKFIEVNFQSFVYNKSTCFRDIGLVIDAVSYDMVFGSNFKSIKAGMSYYRAQASTVIGSQKLATIKAFEYLRDILLETVNDNAVAYASVLDNMTNILSIIENGISELPEFVLPEPTNYSVDYRNARNLIFNNLNFIKAEVVQYITNEYPTLTYDQTLCQRDIGYIIDALRYDLTYGGNSESVIAGTSYYTGTTLVTPTDERTATAGAYTFMASLVLNIAQNIQLTPLQLAVTQTNGTAGSLVAAQDAEALIITIKDIVLDIANTPIVVSPSITWTPLGLQSLFADIQISKTTTQSLITDWIDDNFVNFEYSVSACQKDIEFILNAVTYDLLYQGNSQTVDAADEYYSGGVLQNPGETLQTTEAYKYMKFISEKIVLNETIDSLQTVVPQQTTVPATSAESTKVGSLINIVANIVENGYTSTITLEELAPEIIDNTPVTFHQYSLITSSGHTFEWIGAGINVNTALPYLGGTAKAENQVIEVNGGKVYYTGTDQRGDFRIGNDLVINRNTGTISGRTFTKSLFAVITPYILAIGD